MHTPTHNPHKPILLFTTTSIHTTIPKQRIGNYGVCGWKDRCRDGNLRTYCHVSPILFGWFFVEASPTCFCIFVKCFFIIKNTSQIIQWCVQIRHNITSFSGRFCLPLLGIANNFCSLAICRLYPCECGWLVTLLLLYYDNQKNHTNKSIKKNSKKFKKM